MPMSRLLVGHAARRPCRRSGSSRRRPARVPPARAGRSSCRSPTARAATTNSPGAIVEVHAVQRARGPRSPSRHPRVPRGSAPASAGWLSECGSALGWVSAAWSWRFLRECAPAEPRRPMNEKEHEGERPARGARRSRPTYGSVCCSRTSAVWSVLPAEERRDRELAEHDGDGDEGCRERCRGAGSERATRRARCPIPARASAPPRSRVTMSTASMRSPGSDGTRTAAR